MRLFSSFSLILSSSALFGGWEALAAPSSKDTSTPSPQDTVDSSPILGSDLLPLFSTPFASITSPSTGSPSTIPHSSLRPHKLRSRSRDAIHLQPCDPGKRDIEDLLKLHDLTLTPNPPKPGETLEIIASGLLRAPIQPGATFQITATKFGITVFSETCDLCSNPLSKLDVGCPLGPGLQSISQSFTIPSSIPGGINAKINVQVSNPDGSSILCLQGSGALA
ncbi:MAG: hypothetical protein DHS80DRAFT_29458 [Piptocephalis tieghemiana]|nr:MAG: hypothetical protein DHS80DRAFT_29458 [Piptocephalis tieghemiana]